MRKKNFKSHCSTIGWTIIQFLPIIFFVFVLLFVALNYQQTGHMYQDFEDIYASALSTFYSVVGSAFEGTMLFDSMMQFFDYFVPLENMSLFFAVPIAQFCWYIVVYVIRLGMDFILFIPRLAHKWLHSAYGGDDYE